MSKGAVNGPKWVATVTNLGTNFHKENRSLDETVEFCFKRCPLPLGVRFQVANFTIWAVTFKDFYTSDSNVFRNLNYLHKFNTSKFVKYLRQETRKPMESNDRNQEPYC